MTHRDLPALSALSVGAAVRVASAVALALGIVVMHGLGGPSMDHGAVPGALARAAVHHPAAASQGDPMHADASSPAADRHHEGDRPCGHGDCRSHSSDMAMIGCAVAVLAVVGRARRGDPPTRRLVPFDLPARRGLLLGPEPPVPRFA